MKVLAIKSRNRDAVAWETWRKNYEVSIAAARQEFTRVWLDGSYAELKLVYMDEDTERELEVLAYRKR